MSDKTTYESLDNRIAPEALTKDHTKGLAVIDGHAVKSQEDYEDPDRLYDILIARIRKVSSVHRCFPLIEKVISWQLKHMEISAENPESHISSIRYG